MFELYDKPGARFIDRPNSRKAVRKRVLTLVSVAALAVAPSAAARHVNPGGVHQYHAPHVVNAQ